MLYARVGVVRRKNLLLSATWQPACEPNNLVPSRSTQAYPTDHLLPPLAFPQAWVQLHRLLHLYLRNLVLRALRAWSAITCYYIGLRQRVVAWKAAWEDRRKILLLGLLRDHAVYRRRLRLAAFKVGLGHR